MPPRHTTVVAENLSGLTAGSNSEQPLQVGTVFDPNSDALPRALQFFATSYIDNIALFLRTIQ